MNHNHNHNGCTYAATRYAHEFLEAMAEHKFARSMLGMANTGADPQWSRTRAMKCLNSTKRQRDLAKDKLDRYRQLLKRSKP